MQFLKEDIWFDMCFDWQCLLEYGFQDSCVKFCKICRKIFMIEFTVKEVKVCKIVNFMSEALLPNIIS